MIVTPTAMEMHSVLAFMQHTFVYATIEHADAGYIEQGYIGTIPVYIGICGVGPVLSALTCSEWLARYSITSLVLCGIAGAYSIEELPLSSVVFVTEDIYGEYGIRTGIDISSSLFPFFHDKERTIKDSIQSASPESILDSLGLQYHMCAEVTGITVAGVSGDRATAKQLRSMYTRASIENMEGFSIALASHRSNIPFIHIRSISNEVGIRENWAIEESLITLSETVSSFWGGPWI